VNFGSTAATSVTFDSDVRVFAVTPASLAGTVGVQLINPDGQSATLQNSFTFIGSLAVTGVTPNTGPATGGTSVTVNGSSFQPGASVRFDGIAATSVNVLSGTQISAVTPPHAAGSVTVQVVNPDSQSASLANAFTYQSTLGLTSISPISGPTGGGTSVTLNGTGFLSGVSVFFGGNASPSVTVVSSTQLTATTPAHSAGLVDVSVSNPNGDNAQLAGAFTYADALAISSVVPNAAPGDGGRPVTIFGAGFQVGATVTFGSLSAQSVTFVSSSQLDVLTPVSSSGTVNVTVTNPGGQSATLTNGFTFQNVSISSVSPSSGPASGGTTVTINGNNFASGLTVNFGGVPATSVTFISSSQVTAVTPASPAGTVGVQVVNPTGQSATLQNSFTFIGPPTITSISPNSGPATGGTTFLLTGTGFQTNVAVFIADIQASLDSTSPTEISGMTPNANLTGTVDVRVLNPDGQSATLGGGFTYTSSKTVSTNPEVSSVSPNIGPATGGTQVFITGTNFQPGITVSFGGIQASGVTLLSGGQLSAFTPAHDPGFVNVELRNTDGQIGTAQNAFMFDGLSINSVSPTTADINGGTLVTVMGTGFQSGTTVSFGGTGALSVTFVSEIQLQAVAPSHVQGTVDVQVTNTNGQTATLASGLTFIPPPTLGQLTRRVGSSAGGTKLSITGTAFEPGITVQFGGLGAAVTFVSSTLINVTTPGHAPGLVDVKLTNPSGGSVTGTNAFQYEPAPTNVYRSHGFEDGTISDFIKETSTSGTTSGVTTEAARTGSRSFKCTASGGSVCRLRFRNLTTSGFPLNPPVSEANGLYQRWYMMMPQSTIDNAAAGQIKIHIARYNVNVSNTIPGWLVIGIGREFNCSPVGQLAMFRDQNVAFLPGTCTQLLLQGNRWYEVELLYRRSGGRGFVKVWIDGILKMDTSDTQLGSDSTGDTLSSMWGISFTQNASGAVTMYLDDIALGNGFHEPPP
jgi:hypothetical protein